MVQHEQIEEAQDRFVNRELSWLSFNERVLQEAEDKSVPILERLRFLGIFSNNQDEFFRVRVATIRRVASLGKSVRPILGGMNPKKLLKMIQEVVIKHHNRFNRTYEKILEELETEDIFMINEDTILPEHEAFLKDYFYRKVRPVLVPIMISHTEKWPSLKDRTIYLAVKLSRKGLIEHQPTYSLLEIPSQILPRFIVLPDLGKRKFIMLLDDLIRYRLKEIFSIFDFDTIEAYNLKVTRDAELDLDNDFTQDFVNDLKLSLKKRSKGDPVRLVYDREIPNDLLSFIVERMGIGQEEYFIPGGRYHNFKDFMDFPDLGRPEFDYHRPMPLMHPRVQKYSSLFKVITEGDLLLHYPYQTFSHFTDLLREAAIDPEVKSIKTTLYRVAKHSAVVNSLINAAKNGKQVTAVVELQARFDEEANIKWASRMQEEGIRVIHGVPGLKVHSKLLLIERKEEDGSKLYAQIGTGNFNEKTAKLYCDEALLTADKVLCKEVNSIFDFLEDNSKPPQCKRLIYSPMDTRNRFIELIQYEIDEAKAGRKAEMVLKMNSLSDPEMIDKLYEASEAGVQIRLIIRGICCLIPGIEGLSSRIEGISIVDKYLEHSRIFYFHQGGIGSVYIGSADWMQRNLNNRIELCCPVDQADLKQELIDLLELQWKDNVKARLINKAQDNQYRKVGKAKAWRSQERLYSYIQQSIQQ